MRAIEGAYDWRRAVESCETVLQGDPDHLGALEVLAQAQWFGGLYDAVISTTSRLLKLNPLEPGYRFTRGMAYVSKGHLGRALEDFQTAHAQSRDPKFRAQVQSSIDALEGWLMDAPVRRSRFGASMERPLGRVN